MQLNRDKGNLAELLVTESVNENLPAFELKSC
jgi:hypothetical protein